MSNSWEQIFGKIVESLNTNFVPNLNEIIEVSLKEILLNLINNQAPVDDQDIEDVVDQVDQMKGREFEEFLAECFHRLGYQVQVTPTSNDFGADLILQQYGIKTVVQAKRYQKKVGSAAVQEVVGAIKYYRAMKAIVITNNIFTRSAYKLASPNNVELWDRQKLIDLIKRVRES